MLTLIIQINSFTVQKRHILRMLPLFRIIGSVFLRFYPFPNNSFTIRSISSFTRLKLRLSMISFSRSEAKV